MQLTDMAWAGLTRRKGRFGFMLAAMILGIGTVVALVSLSRAMRAEVSDELDRFGANIVVTPKARAIDLAYGTVAVGAVTVDARELSTGDAARIRTIPNKRNISAVAPKLIGTASVDATPMLLIGVNFRQERGIKSWWHIDGTLPASRDEALVGAEAARTLGKSAGDVVEVGGRRLRVAGTIGATGGLDDQAVLADLALVQGMLGKADAVSVIEVSALCRGCPIEDIVEQIAAVLPHARVAPIRQAVAARERAVGQFTRFAYAVSAIVLLVGALVVLTTMMAAVSDRVREIGVLRAIGFRQRQVAVVLIMESLVVTAAGGLGGWLAGVATARYAGPALGQLADPVAVDVWLAPVAVGLAVVIGLSGTLYPAMRAARLDPSDSLRHL
jgi:putative ABC transport system permease protein